MSPRRVFVAVLFGVILVQAAWILAMPAFRGPDEFDHVYRAEGITHGALRPGDEFPGIARGSLTPVRLSVIEAASAVCDTYSYTLYYNCNPLQDSDKTWNVAGSGAGRYNPTYYVIVGNVGRFFEGVAVDYAIRVTTALACALMIAWAASMWVGIGRSAWLTLGFTTALTPVFLYSTAIAAPNGVSYSAALLLWVAGLRLMRETGAPSKPALAAMALGSVLLSNTHTTGPLWLAFIFVALALVDVARFRELLGHKACWGAIGAIGLGLAFSAVWTVLSGANVSGMRESTYGNPVISEFLLGQVLWLLQTIAAFPLRNEHAPVSVYILWLVPSCMLATVAFVSGRKVLRPALFIIVALLGTITVLTFISYHAVAYAWQGRYGLPLAIGVALVPVAMTRRSAPPRPLMDCALAGMAAATGISVWHVSLSEEDAVRTPLTNHLAGGSILAGLIAAAGFAVIAWALAPHRTVSITDPPEVLEQIPASIEGARF